VVTFQRKDLVCLTTYLSYMAGLDQCKRKLSQIPRSGPSSADRLSKVQRYSASLISRDLSILPVTETQSLEQNLVWAIQQNQWNRLILERAPQLGFEDWWLTAGCIAQSVWNLAADRDIHAGIRDYDLFYYDPNTSWAAEDAVIRNAGELFADLPVEVQIRNQARVPIWYETKFGIPFGAVTRASDGIDRFPCATVAVGVRRREACFEVYSPFGLRNLFDGRLRPNKALPIPHVYAEKTDRWQREWSHLSRESW
jgi:uncharacterized protein